MNKQRIKGLGIMRARKDSHRVRDCMSHFSYNCTGNSVILRVYPRYGMNIPRRERLSNPLNIITPIYEWIIIKKPAGFSASSFFSQLLDYTTFKITKLKQYQKYVIEFLSWWWSYVIHLCNVANILFIVAERERERERGRTMKRVFAFSKNIIALI